MTRQLCVFTNFVVPVLFSLSLSLLFCFTNYLQIYSEVVTLKLIVVMNFEIIWFQKFQEIIELCCFLSFLVAIESQ